jgi:copper chaperone CopZ
MPDESSASTPRELQVLLDLDLTIKGLSSAVDQQRLESALVDVPGIDSVRVAENKVTIRYHPQKLTKAKLSESIAAAGFSIAESTSAPPTPPVGDSPSKG